MSTVVKNIGEIAREWTDISSKVKAAAAGGVTAGGVTSVLAAVLPHWHPASWEVGAITIGVAIISGYVKGEKVTLDAGVETTTASGAVSTVAQSFALPDIGLHADVAAALAAADSVGSDEQEQTPQPVDAPKHVAS
jgi:hypothetical protein